MNKKYLAELIGTFLLTFAVIASLAAGFPVATPVFAGITLGLFVYTMGGVSGAHVNPAVTIGLLSIKKISPKEAVLYVIAQLAGSVLALLLARYLFSFSSSLMAVDNFKILLAETIGAFILVFGVTSVVLKENSSAYSGVVIGGSLLLGASIASRVSNGVLNPAVALGIGSFSLVYVIGPIVGGLIAAQLVKWLIGPGRGNI
jgi:glycerol uptake facilitator-like aquaporin